MVFYDGVVYVQTVLNKTGIKYNYLSVTYVLIAISRGWEFDDHILTPTANIRFGINSF